MNAAAQHGAHRRGILFLIVAVSCLGAVDGMSKILVHHQPFGQIMLARYALTLPVVLLSRGFTGLPGLFRTGAVRLQMLRGLVPLFVGGNMMFAVKYLPLAEATVILFAGPFLVVALSGIMLGERVARSSWIGVALGFLAVLLVARPGIDALSLYTIFPAVAAFFYAVFQLLSRRLGAMGEHPVTTLAWTLAVGNTALLPIAVWQWQTPDLQGWFELFLLGAVFGVGQYFLARAFALAPANLLTPFSYVQIVAAVIFGIVVFGDVPDAWTITGTVLVLAAGLYVFTRTRK